MEMKAESPQHKRLVRSLVGWIESKGFEIKCASDELHNQCVAVDDLIPDAKGYNPTLKLNAYGEAKTSDDIDNEHSRKQFRVFTSWEMKKSGKQIPLYVAIEKGSSSILLKVLRELGIEDKVFWKEF